jgi:predicted transposase/invertase (TIGR01784 family)
MKFVDPKNDLAFKKIFGNEEKKEILISFLNSILDFSGDREIVDITILNPYQAPKIEELKETILDIRATDRANNQFIVEMQKNDKGDFAKRSLYYTSKAYVSQLESGKEYKKLKSVYFIGILNFTIFDGKNHISRHLILNRETLKQEIKDFDFTFIELPKFKKELKELISTADRWVYFIQNANKLELVPKEFEAEEFKEAFQIANSYGWNRKELEIYDYMRLKEMDARNEIETAKNKGFNKGFNRGVEQGLEQGLTQGLEQGLTQGLEQGEKKAKIEIAKTLLSIGDSLEKISQVTGLSVDELKKINY